MRFSFNHLALIFILFFSGIISAEERLIITEKTSDEVPLSQVLYLAKQPVKVDLAYLESAAIDWQQYEDKHIRGINNKTYWLKFSISQIAKQTRQQTLSLANPHLDFIELYHVKNSQLVEHLHLGDLLPFKQREVISTNFLYSFSSNQLDNHQFYLKIDNTGAANIPLTLWSSDAYYQDAELQAVFYGFQLGILAAIGLFSLFIAITSHSFSYTYFSGYVLSITFFVATLHGLAFRFIWPNFPVLQQYALPALLSLSMMFVFLFSEKVMQFKYHNQTMLRLCRICAALSILLLISGLFLSYTIALKLTIYSVMFASVMLMYMSATQAFKGYKLAKLFAIGWIGMMLGSLLSGALYLDLINWDIEAKTPFLIGLSFEVLFMAALLAIRYNDERLAKLKIQQEALAQAKEAKEHKDKALRIEARSSEQLSQKVQERTLELEIALRELNDANQKLTEQAKIDSLTGVKNRNSFDKRIVAEGRISRRQQTPMSILMLDLDHFKSINDSYGHLAGDQALRVVATTLKQNLKRPTDLVSRFGGEEFAIILPNTDQVGALQVAETIRKAISEQPIIWGDDSFPLTVSIGVKSEIVTSEEHTTLLLEQADKALYQAKNEGRNRTKLYSPI
ncbi:deoxynucleoside kinase [Shewanella sairae]|uniref:diguanylate cyclase n=1 Tax=Shewanella sairae TaxID=190310 RepID=A0ABQ4P0V8_9GAMM|nr:diguanylate cyclase [Shewanella sairae]MCL1129534.1 diguanylate cyclase [Shewanella sairae]GIU41115.1 deoxynucleoside kinase [Shewanella sairae]